MHPTLRHLSPVAAALISTFASTSAVACATCGCSLSTDAAMGYGSATGWRVSLQYDFINQDQLRSGTSPVSSAQVAQINNGGGSQEVEHQTINRYTTLGVSYAPNADWNFRVLVPYIDRTHTTYGNATTSMLTPSDISGASITGLGDIKLIAGFQGLLPDKNLGVQLGIKLPTGDYGGANAAGTGVVGRSPAPFTTGPNSQVPSPGNLVDTSLQPGNGSTDLIVGAYYHQALSLDVNGFVNGQFQASVTHLLDQQGQDYRPGNTSTVSFGARYEANPMLVPQLQVNISRKGADQGALADTTDTAGTVAYLSPGISVSVTRGISAFAFVQVPIWSHLSGYQLFPRWTATLGMSYGF